MTTTPWEPIPAGTVLRGRYQIEVLLGRGGFGATYRALDRERFNAPCALKELLPLQAENPKARELFEREARTLLALRHPGIPVLHAYFVEATHYYLVEDFVAGDTVAAMLERRGRFSEAEVVRVLEETLGILEYLHERTPAVIHRDLKPANLIRSDNGGLYVIDFGAVKEAVGITTLSDESTVIGTSGFTPPEQLRGMVVPASDLYALGATAVQLLTGRPPAEWYDIVEGRWRFDGKLGVTAHLERVLLGLLSAQLRTRFKSAREVLAALHGSASRVRSHPQTEAFRSRTTVLDAPSRSTPPETIVEADESNATHAPIGSKKIFFGIGAAIAACGLAILVIGVPGMPNRSAQEAPREQPPSTRQAEQFPNVEQSPPATAPPQTLRPKTAPAEPPPATAPPRTSPREPMAMSGAYRGQYSTADGSRGDLLLRIRQEDVAYVALIDFAAPAGSRFPSAGEYRIRILEASSDKTRFQFDTGEFKCRATTDGSFIAGSCSSGTGSKDNAIHFTLIRSVSPPSAKERAVRERESNRKLGEGWNRALEGR